MKSIKLALLGGAALAVTAAAAHADDLATLKAQIETLNSRVAAMETAPAVPAGYQLLAVSKGAQQQVPGLGQSDADRVGNDRATIISVMPTADAPAGTTISWSGYVRAGIVYNNNKITAEVKDSEDGVEYFHGESESNNSDTDVKTRGQLRVVGTTDTAVGEVGVELKMRADLNGNGASDVYMQTAWGYWAMTPELTLGGGYAGSLGNVGYGYDGACTCYYTDNADVDFNPGDTTQMRLSYASGPFSMGIALEDASLSSDSASGDQLGVAGELKYSGDAVSGEVSGVWRDRDQSSGATDLWQVGAGLGFSLGEMASLSLGAALGEGPYQTVNDNGTITSSYNYNQSWWGVSGLASANLSDQIHAEVAAGYKSREGDSFEYDGEDSDGVSYSTWAVLGGMYYQPVDQLTIGLEAEYYTREASWETQSGDFSSKYELTQDNMTVDLVSVWRF